MVFLSHLFEELHWICNKIAKNGTKILRKSRSLFPNPTVGFCSENIRKTLSSPVWTVLLTLAFCHWKSWKKLKSCHLVWHHNHYLRKKLVPLMVYYTLPEFRYPLISRFNVCEVISIIKFQPPASLSWGREQELTQTVLFNLQPSNLLQLACSAIVA